MKHPKKEQTRYFLWLCGGWSEINADSLDDARSIVRDDFANCGEIDILEVTYRTVSKKIHSVDTSHVEDEEGDPT